MKYFAWIKNLLGIWTTLATGFVLSGISMIFGFSYFEAISKQILEQHIQHIEEYIIFSLLLFIGILIDLQRLKNRMRENAAKEKMESFRATMRTVQDLINNSFNSLQILRMEAEESGALNAESLLLFDSIIKSTSKKMTLLGDLEDIVLTKNNYDVEIISYPDKM